MRNRPACAESVGGDIAACGASVLEDGFNPIADVSCLSAIGSSVVDPVSVLQTHDWWQLGKTVLTTS